MNIMFSQVKRIMSSISSKSLKTSMPCLSRPASNNHSNMQSEPARIEKTINSVQLLGRVGADPQRKGTEDHPVVVFSLATHTNYRYESGEFMQRTEWHRVICFKPGLREAVLNYLKKGQRVHVQGRISYGEVRGDDGKPRNTTAIAADDVIFFQNPAPEG